LTAEVLERELAKAAKTDDQHARAGLQPGSRAAYRVIGGQSRVRERRGSHRVERTERQKVARPWYEHRLCVAAIDLEAGRSTGGASLLVPGAAFAALTAAPSAKDEHRIPCLEASGLQILSCIGS